MKRMWPLLPLFMLAPTFSHADPLHDAVEAGDLNQVKELVAAGENLKRADPLLGTPLHVAATFGHAEIARYLIAEGANPRAKYGMFRYTPLHAAAISGQPDIIDLLLESGAKTEDKDMSLNTPLHLAADAGQAAAVETLVSRGADLMAENESNVTPIHYAGAAGHFDIVDYLFESGVVVPPVEPITELLATASAENGEKLFGACRECHTAEKHGEHRGPNLWGIFEREKGSHEAYELYTQALLRLGGKWSYEEMNAFLADPKAYMPGTGMAEFQGMPDASDRADLIAYLRLQGDQPPPLPE